MSNAALLLADNPPFMQARIFFTRWNGLGKADGSVDVLDDGEYSGSVLHVFFAHLLSPMVCSVLITHHDAKGYMLFPS